MPDGDVYRGRTVAERNIERGNKAFGKSPEGARIVKLEGQSAKQEGDIGALKGSVDALEAFNKGLKGNDGITVNGNVIGLDAKQLRIPEAEPAAPAATGTLKFYGVSAAVFVAWDVQATETTL